MTATPQSKLSSPFSIKNVHLKVANLENMSRFYQEEIGLELIKKEAKQAHFAARDSQDVILILEEIAGRAESEPKSGLYHMAFLLPTRKDLANQFLSFHQNEIPLVGASDHSYSEALYLKDPEGNEIEIYVDKDISEWNILEDGTITGVTEHIDLEGVLSEADGKWLGMAPGTTMGHVHLYVSDLEATEDFFYNLLGIGLKYNFGAKAKFFAVGNYHHHIGANLWKGIGMPPLADDEYGMAYYTLQVSSETDYRAVKNRLSKADYPFTEADNTLTLVDPNGIVTKLTF